MTKAELVEEVSRVSDLTKKHSEVIVDTVFQTIVDALHRGEKIELRGFGSYRYRKLPKPRNSIVSPRCRASTMVWKTVSTMTSECFFVRSETLDTSSTSSAFV